MNLPRWTRSSGRIGAALLTTAVLVGSSAAPVGGSTPPGAIAAVDSATYATDPAPTLDRLVAPAIVSRSSYSVGHLSIALVPIAGSFSNPLFVANAHDGTNRLFVVEQGGRIRVIQKGVLLATPFLDIHTKVSCCGERGLLGLAFSPKYKTNGKFYVDYTDVNGNTVIAEYHRSTTNRASTSARILLRITQPYANHNGGMIAFGPDGYLYIGMGDGGSGGDPGNRAQNRSNPLGKILRINVNTRTGKLAYGIPSGNPYVGRAGDDRVWAYGLRNPWRFSFDSSTGDLWIGDVGQDRYEEIDRATRASGGGRGANFGWRVMEGRACYNPSSGCNTSGKRLPIAVYSHAVGCAVIGGYVYRGSLYPAMVGAYLFSDNCSGRIWALKANGASTQTPQQLLDTGLAISSFGQGENGTLYVTDLVGGRVYRVTGTSK
ncbi:MAG TPA: PQQ-dependent sugar dehydrogenase [Candidatus Acidoferrum sp.]|nr:PQQ-dependent sugar dehydrogenase [Candidatus Acidoferrum sp.]